MPQFRITEAVSLRRVKKPKFLYCNSGAVLQFFFFSTSNAPPTVSHTSHRPAHLRRTPPTISHNSDMPGHRFIACTAPPLHRLHRTATTSPAPSRRFPAPLWLLFLRPTITVVAPSSSRALPLELHAPSRRLLMNALLKFNEKMSVLLNFNKMKMNVWLKFNKMKLKVWLKLNLRKTSNLLGQFKKVWPLVLLLDLTMILHFYLILTSFLLDIGNCVYNYIFYLYNKPFLVRYGNCWIFWHFKQNMFWNFNFKFCWFECLVIQLTDLEFILDIILKDSHLKRWSGLSTGLEFYEWYLGVC